VVRQEFRRDFGDRADTTGTRPQRAGRLSSRTVRFWAFFVITALAVFSGGAGHLAARVPIYSAQALIAFVPVGEKSVSAAAVELMVPRYVAYATSPYVVRQVAASTGLPASRVQRRLTVVMAATTANVTVSMSSTDPALAAAVANTIADLVVARAGTDPVVGARLLARAPVPAEQRGPSERALLAGMAAIALLLGLAAGLAARTGAIGRWAVRWGLPGSRPAPGTESAGPLPAGAVPAWPGPERFVPNPSTTATGPNPWGAALAAGRIPSADAAAAEVQSPGHTAAFSLDELDDAHPDVDPDAPADARPDSPADSPADGDLPAAVEERPRVGTRPGQ
jgi:capsular polysaccharide biosynthesis protein